MNDSPIVRVIKRYYPDWEEPEDNYREWVPTRCPFHGESTPSAAISYDLQGFNCFACDVRGDVISIIRHEEGVSFAEAVRVAEEISVGCNVPLQRKPPRKPSRRVPGEPGDSSRDKVRAGIRGRAAPWT